jgi:16S rRNA (cytosine967-C5)-methyltransferase
MCAGGAGKSRLLHALGVSIVSADIDERRMRDVPEGIRRVTADGRLLNPTLAGGMFDVVLLDAPCSGSGTLRRSPDVAWRLQQRDVDELQKLQQELLLRAATLVNPGGHIVYATCSLLKQECTTVVQHACAQDARLQVVPPATYAGGINTHDDIAVTLRPDIHGTDGYMCAVLQVRG